MSHNYADAWKRYLTRITGGASNAAIARTLGINDGTVSRWMKAEVTPA